MYLSAPRSYGSAASRVITRHVASDALVESGRVPRAHEGGLSLSADARLDLRSDSLHA